MCALQIDPGYLAKINPQQIKNLESQGLLTKNEKGEYFAEPGVFPENCFVQAAQKNAPAAGVSQTGKPAPAAEKKPMKGVELEKSNAPKDKNIVSETYTTTVAFDEATQEGSNIIVGPFAINYVYNKNFSYITEMTLETDEPEHKKLVYGTNWIITKVNETTIIPMIHISI